MRKLFDAARFVHSARPGSPFTPELAVTGHQGSGILSSMSAADCFIVLPRGSGAVGPGDTVWVEPFEGTT